MQHGRQGQSPIDRLFALADTNKDGKLTKDEVANFFWSRLEKADVKHQNFVTKEDLKAYHKEQVKELRAEHHEKAHKGHEKAHKGPHAKQKAKKNKGAAPAAKPAEQKAKPKTESKAEVTPAPQVPAKTESKAEAKPELKGKSTPAVKAAVRERVKEPKAGTSAT
jgi:hypothetical protein